MTETKERWNIFIHQVLADTKLWFLALLAQIFWHLVFFLIVVGDIQTYPTFIEGVYAVFNAFRFDIKIAVAFTLVPFLCITFPASLFARESYTNILRQVWLVVIWLVTCIANLGQIGYYNEYKNTFDFNLFALVYDDFGAILSTMYYEYNLLLYLLILCACLWIGAGVLIKVYRRPWFAFFVKSIQVSGNGIQKHILGIFVLLLVLFLLVVGGRGSLGDLPLQYRHIEVTRDPVINRTTLNPFNSFIDSYIQHQQVLSRSGINTFTNKPIVEVVQRLFPERRGRTLDDFTSKRVAGMSQRPRHIFLLVMESYSSWPLLEKYQDINLLQGIKKLAAQPSGHLFLNFLPSSSGTMTSFASIITGLQDVNVYTNYQQQSRKPYATSLPSQFSRIGYKTRFFYGGSQTWHDIGSFLRHQGVEDIHSWADISTPSVDLSTWGLPDGQLFDYILRNVDDSEPSLNIIMSVSFHPPYNLNLDELGVDKGALQHVLDTSYPDSVDANTLGHWKYADEQMYRFVSTMDKKLDNSLFVVTGDHYARNKHPLQKPPLYETTSVPLLLYGDMLADLSIDTTQPGTHLDITPTLIELSGPSGLFYHSLGNSMLETGNDVAISSRAAISRDFIADIGQLPMATSLTGESVTLDNTLSSNIRDKFNLIGAYSWWRIIKGKEIQLDH